jgi:hypothetical protein
MFKCSPELEHFTFYQVLFDSFRVVELVVSTVIHSVAKNNVLFYLQLHLAFLPLSHHSESIDSYFCD